jgi:hypothetical protein
VHLLQAQDALRLQAEGRAAEVGAGLEDPVPQMLAVGTRTMQLIAEFADEADAQEQAWEVGNLGAFGVEVRK